jgi:hypothetical protein
MFNDNSFYTVCQYPLWSGDDVVGGKHGKYVYIKIKENEYVKARVFKNKADDDPEKYLVTGPKRSSAPLNYPVVDIEDLPIELQDKLLGRAPVEEKEEESAEESQ